MEAGLDSLSAVSFRSAVADSLRISVPHTLAFDYPTIRAISAHIGQIVANHKTGHAETMVERRLILTYGGVLLAACSSEPRSSAQHRVTVRTGA
jgi:hypothetical protein